MPLSSLFFSRNNNGGGASRPSAHTQVVPVISEPPPPASKRQEKEKAWLASISSLNLPSSAGTSSRRSRAVYPPAVEHIGTGRRSGKDGNQENSSARLGAQSSRRGRQHSSESASSGAGGREQASTRSGFASLRLPGTVRDRDSGKRGDDAQRAPERHGPAETRLMPYKETEDHRRCSPIASSAISYVDVGLPSPHSLLQTAPRRSASEAGAASIEPVPHVSATDDYFIAGKAAPSSLLKRGEHSSLAVRLRELEEANQAGLLNDDEYRLLKENVFKTAVGGTGDALAVADRAGQSSQDIQPPDGIGRFDRREEGIERTGTLLQLPRLATVATVSSAPQPSPESKPSAEASAHANASLALPSSDSIRSKSGRLSLRSTRSALTVGSARLSSLFRRAASTPAADVERNAAGDGASTTDLVISRGKKEGSTGSVRRKTSGAAKHPIPDDWRRLQSLHMAEAAREDAKGTSGFFSQQRGRSVTADTVLAAAPPVAREHDRQYRTMRSRGSAVAESGPSCDMATAKATDLPWMIPAEVPETKGHVELTDGSDQTIRRLRSDSRLTATSSTAPSATARSRSGSTAQYPSARPFSVVQASEEGLDSRGLQAAIAAVQQEKERLVGQFEQLELAVLAKSGATSSAKAPEQVDAGRTLGRREYQTSQSARGHEQEQHAHRRGSLSSSLFSQTASGAGLPHQAASANLSRRPSIASTTLSSGVSSQRTAISRDAMSSSGTLGLGLLPPAVNARLLPAMNGLRQGDEHEEKEVLEVKHRRQDVEERYSARLEYLEARLKSQLLKEKLAR